MTATLAENRLRGTMTTGQDLSSGSGAGDALSGDPVRRRARGGPRGSGTQMCRGSGRRVTQGNHPTPGCYSVISSGRRKPVSRGRIAQMSTVTCITRHSSHTLSALVPAFDAQSRCGHPAASASPRMRAPPGLGLSPARRTRPQIDHVYPAKSPAASPTGGPPRVADISPLIRMASRRGRHVSSIRRPFPIDLGVLYNRNR